MRRLARSPKRNKRKVVSGSRVTLPENFAYKPELSFNPLARMIPALGSSSFHVNGPALVWDQSGIRIIGTMRVSVCLGAILILEYLDFHSGYSSPRSRIAGIYSGIYFYSGISQTNAPLKTTAVVIFKTRKIYAK